LIASDGLHPSNSGHARLAQIVLNAVRSWHMWAGK
jgi:lysophospholipase L1-like esterase